MAIEPGWLIDSERDSSHFPRPAGTTAKGTNAVTSSQRIALELTVEHVFG